MPRFSSTILLSVLLTGSAGVVSARRPAQAPPPPSMQLSQVTIEQRVIIRIPLVRQPVPQAGPGQRAALAPPLPDAPPPPVTFKEVKGPKCLKLDQIRGALINNGTGITMVTDRDRFPARLGRSCRAGDFYSGFYLEPTKDGSICAGRDTIHTRNGSTCGIEHFMRLVPDDDD